MTTVSTKKPMLLTLLALTLASAPLLAQNEDPGADSDPVEGEDETDAGVADSGDTEEMEGPSEAEMSPVPEPEREPEPEPESEPKSEPEESRPDWPKCAKEDCTVKISGTETLSSEYVGDNGDFNESYYGDDDNFWVFRNILYGRANSKPFDAGIRLDTTLFNNPPLHASPEVIVDTWGPGASGYSSLDYKHDIRVERMYATLKYKRLKFTAGDSYATFGHGIALSLIKLDDLSVDNSLRGGRGEFSVPGKFKGILLGGYVNSINYDQLTHQVLEDDPLDKIAGMRLELEPTPNFTLGVHGVILRPRFEKESEVEEDRNYVDQGTGISANTVGGTIELRAGDLGFFFEGDGQVHDNYRPVEELKDVKDEIGYAGFTELSYDFLALTLKIQGFYFYKWLMEGPYRGSSTNIATSQPSKYSKKINLEPTWMPIKSQGNNWGVKLMGDGYISASKTQIIASTTFLKYNGELVPAGQWEELADYKFVHPLLSLRQEIGDSGFRVSLEGGYAVELTPVEEQENGSLWHGMVDVLLPLSGPHSIKVRSDLRRHDLNTEAGDPYYVNMNTLGYDWSGTLGVSFLHEYSDQTAGIDAKIGDWTYFMPRKHYLQTKITYDLPDPLSGLRFQLVGGSQRGGRKCVGGGCRDLPDSVGVRLDTIYRF
jgi:hypothetical protein